MSMDFETYVETLMAKARKAQEQYAGSTQKQLNSAARIAAKTVYDNAEMFAREAVEETRLGNVEDKIAKQRNLLKDQWCFTKDKITTGVVGWEQGKLNEDCILKIAKPLGVICGVMPSTNPTATLAANCMQALKTGNAIIVCPHPRAQKVSMHCVEMIREAIKEVGAPEDLVQCTEIASMELTGLLMHAADVVVATGGPGVVNAANSSGKPSLGVGQGNCQVCIDHGMTEKFDEMAEKMIPNRAFDNAILCSGEQMFILPAEDAERFKKAIEAYGAMVIDDEAVISKIRSAIFVPKKSGDGYQLNVDLVGKSAREIAAAVGIAIPEGVKLLVARISEFGEKELLCREKLLPVSCYFPYEGNWDTALKIAKANLMIEGAGHSAVVYSDDKDHQLRAGLELPVCRVVINNCDAAIGGGRYYDTGTVATSGVGCGYWQHNILSENLNYSHLLNYTRMIFTVQGKEPPTDEEIWAEEE